MTCLDEFRPETAERDLDALQHQIGAWANATFPGHDDRTITEHINEEAAELLAAVREWGRKPRCIDEEAADVAILLLTLAHHRGFSLNEAIAAKHRINQRREWGRGPRVTGDMPNSVGIVHHAGHNPTL